MTEPPKGNNEDRLNYFILQSVLPDWTNIVRRIHQEIEEPLKNRALHAVMVFRKILGEKFFNKNIEGHPLQKKWGNIVPWQLAQLCEWADVLSQLQHAEEDIQYLSSLLIKKEKCEQEGVHFLNIASSLLQAGFTIKFIRGQQNVQLPDIEVKELVSGEVFFIEVTHLQKSAQYESDEKNFNQISNACLHYGFNLLKSVQIIRSLDESELNAAVFSIQQTAAAAYRNNNLQVLRKEFIDIAFAPGNAEQSFNSWLNNSGRKKGVHGIEVKVDETARLINRIQKKVKQFPDGVTGIIYFGVQFLYFLVMDYESVLSALKKIMKIYPHLKGIVLSCDVIDPDTHVLKEFDGREDIFCVRSSYGHSIYSLYCVNDFYKGKVNAGVFALFRKSLMPRN